MRNLWLPIIAIFVGFFGDLLVQAFVKLGGAGSGGWGLKSYFQQHGMMASALIAAGILGVFYSIWTVFNLPLRWEFILIVALVLDLIWNYAHIMPSLNNYYKEPAIPRTILGVVIPFLLPLLIYAIFKGQLPAS